MKNRFQNIRLYCDQVQRILAQSVIGMGVTLTVALILALALWPVMPHPRIILWLAAVFFVVLVRMAVQLHLRKTPTTPENVSRRHAFF